LITAHHVIYGYTKGIFPMADPDNNHQIEWYEPKFRGIIELDNCNIPKSVNKLFKSNVFECKLDTCFEKVMRCCAEREETWISEELIEIYCELHKMGYAHSFETWYNGELVGGLYGVALHRIFFGESMFHKKTNASKVAMAYLIETLQENNFLVIDTQYLTDHLKQFGAKEVSKNTFSQILNDCIK